LSTKGSSERNPSVTEDSPHRTRRPERNVRPCEGRASIASCDPIELLASPLGPLAARSEALPGNVHRHASGRAVSMAAQKEKFSHDIARILAENERRRREIPLDFYSLTHPANLFMVTQRNRLLLRLLRRERATCLAARRILDVGCGKGEWLMDFLSWGVTPEFLSGIDIDQQQIAEAARRLPKADLRVGNAAELPWPDASFDIVLQATLFSSILNADFRKAIADEMIRVTKPGGLILWYDLRFDNPWNPSVRGIRTGEIKKLFRGCVLTVKSTTLLPPLARKVVPVSWMAALLLEKVPLLRTHLLACIRVVPRRRDPMSKKRAQGIGDRGSSEFVSVIIPMYNAASYVGRCLRSVLEQDYPPERVEIIVGDGASTDSSAAVVRSFVREYPRIRLLSNPMRRVCHALNIGIRDSRGDVVIFVGCRGVLAPDFIRRSVENLRKVKEAAVVGGVPRMTRDSFLEKAIGLALSCPFGVGTARYRYATEPQFTDTVQFGAYRRKIFDEIGLADEDMIFADDDELNWRIVKAGHKIFMNPEINFLYYPRKSICALFRQYFGYGRGRAMAVKKHPDQLRLKHIIPSVFVLFLIAGVVVSLFTKWARIPYPAILGTYVVLSLAASARIAAREGWKLLFILPLLFFTIHIAYGLGFLRESFLGHRRPKPIEMEKPP